MNTIISILSFFIAVSVCGQHIVRGTLTDYDDGTPLPSVNIIIGGTKTGTISDSNGNFSIQCNTFPATLVFSHVSYEKHTTIVNSPNVSHLNIVLKKSMTTLPPFRVHEEKIICLNPKDKYFITDYMILNGHIVALAYKNRMHGNQFLLEFDVEGNKINELQILSNEGLYEDPQQNCYIKMQKKGWQIFSEDGELFFSEPFEMGLIDSAAHYLAGLYEDTIIVRRYHYYNQILDYFWWAPETESAEEFRTYINEDAIGMLSWGAFFDGNEFDQRFMEQIFFKPVQAPLFFHKGGLIIFNVTEGVAEHLNGISGNMEQRVELEFCRDKNWVPEFIHDGARDRFYTIFRRKGISIVAEIDIYTGKIKHEVTLNGYAHIEKIRVWNGQIFFLYKQYMGDDYKRLYMSSLY